MGARNGGLTHVLGIKLGLLIYDYDMTAGNTVLCDFICHSGVCFLIPDEWWGLDASSLRGKNESPRERLVLSFQVGVGLDATGFTGQK